MAEISLIRNHYEDLRVMFDNVLKEKNNADAGKTQEVAEMRKNAALLFVLIKKINRNVKYRVRAGRDKLQEEKLQMDSKLLQLQNLLYESKHLKREVRNSYQFRSQDEDIDLLPETEFIQIKGPEFAQSSQHTIRLGRLECELNLRKQLAEHYKEILNSKKQLVQEIALQADCLASFAPSLRTLVKAARPLQEALKMPIEQEWKLSQLVQLLPKALYLAYMNIHALEVSSPLEDAEVRATVMGVEDEVLEGEIASQVELIKEQNKSLNELESSEQEEQDLSEPHPLTVLFTMVDKSSPDARLEVTLRYFPLLELVTANSVIISKEPDTMLGEMTASHDILKNLFDEDFGDVLPSSKAKYKLQSLNMSAKECLDDLNTKSYGKPYRWLQQMCGIEEMSNNSARSHQKDDDVMLHRVVPNIMKRLQGRWSSRLNLMSQIKALVSKNFDFYLRNEKHPLTKPSSSLVQWTTVDWEEYSGNTNTSPYISAGMVTESNFFYRAVVVRGSAKMECLVSVSHKFPLDGPLWVICVYWNGQHSAANNTAIKMMEAWTNALQQHQLDNKSGMLSAQLVRTMYSFDVFLETEGPFYSPVEYATEKHFLKAFSKRVKARPYRYIEGTINSFKQ